MAVPENTGTPPALRDGAASRLLRNSAFGLAGQGLPLLVALASMPFIVRGLGPDRFAILTLAWAVVAYFSFLDLGLGRAVTNLMAEAISRGETVRIPDLAATVVRTQWAVGLVTMLLLIATSRLIVDHGLNVPTALRLEAIHSFYALGLSIPAVVVSNAYRGILEAHQRFAVTNAVRVPLASAIFLLPLIGMLLSWSLPAIVASLTASRWIGLVVYQRVARDADAAAGAFSRDELVALWKFGRWAAVNNLVVPGVVFLDRMVIGALLPLSAIAYYVGPYEVATKLLVIPGAVAAAVFPVLSGMRAPAAVAGALATTVRMVVLAITPPVVVVLLFSNEIVSVLLGADYAAASTLVFQLLLLAVLLNAIVFAPAVLLEAYGRPDLVTRYHVIELPVYLLVSVIAVRTWGIEGAAAAWLLRMSWTLPIIVSMVVAATRLQGELQVRRVFVWPSAVALGTAAAAVVVSSSSLVLRLILTLVTIGMFLHYAHLWRMSEHGDSRQVAGDVPAST